MVVAIRAEGVSYTKSDLRILEYIENHTEEFLLMSIGQLAGELGMSEATVSRFVRHIGYGDFKELKSRIARESTGRGAARKLADLYNVPIEGPNKADDWLLEQLGSEQTRMWGLPPGQPFTPDRWLNQGDEVTVGNETLKVFHCPGHSPGHVIFFHAPTKVAISGDVLFAGSIGRTDLPKGSFKALEKSIRENMYTLGDDVQFIPGHGPVSSIGQERRNNAFVRDKN